MAIFKHLNNVLALSALCIILCLAFLIRKKIWKKSSRVPTNWPVIGMLPALLQNAHRLHDFATEFLKQNGGTFELKGPAFANFDMLLTSDPANIDYIHNKNFNNYPKGTHFQKMFEIFGDGILNTDSELWDLHRKTTNALMNHVGFRASLERTVCQTLESGLFPVLDHYAQTGAYFDLQEIFKRLSFDIGFQVFLDKNPGSLFVEPPSDHPFRKAIIDAVNAILYRHILPERLWKLQKWFVGIDREKKHAEAWDTFDKFIYPILSEKLNQLQDQDEDDSNSQNFSMLTSHMKAYQGKPMQFLRDTFVSLTISGGGGTTSSALTWLFLLLAKNPSVEAKLFDEILKVKPQNHAKQTETFKVEECCDLVYLHAAFCESLRLFPPIPMNHKMSLETDTLPSGHKVKPKTRILTSFYSMGRMETIWGEDCMEFKPERWISDSGGIKHVPSNKFPIFSVGPRTCIGQKMFFMVAKIVAASIIFRYHCELMEPHPLVVPSDTLVLEVKHGVKVKLTKRQ